MNLDSLIPIMLTIMGALLAGSATFLFRGGTTPPPTPDQPRRTISASHLVLTIFAVIVVLFRRCNPRSILSDNQAESGTRVRIAGSPIPHALSFV
jgi:hypothetical protein